MRNNQEASRKKQKDTILSDETMRLPETAAIN